MPQPRLVVNHLTVRDKDGITRKLERCFLYRRIPERCLGIAGNFRLRPERTSGGDCRGLQPLESGNIQYIEPETANDC